MTAVWTLVGPDGKKYQSTVPGALGGHSGSRVYGARLQCGFARHRSRRLSLAARLFSQRSRCPGRGIPTLRSLYARQLRPVETS